MKINATEIRVGMILDHKQDCGSFKTNHVKPERWSICTS